MMLSKQPSLITLTAFVASANGRFEEPDARLEKIVQGARAKFDEIDEHVRRTGDGTSPNKKTSFPPDKNIVPKTFSDDIHVWRRWKESVSKYFDEGRDSIKRLLDEVARSEIAITTDVLEKACRDDPSLISDLQQWKRERRR